MAAPVSFALSCRQRLLAGALWTALSLLASQGHAQALRDPTLPPSLEGVPAAGSPAVPPGPELQSVLLSPQRKVAIISGQSVGLGERYGDARLVQLSDSSATLRRGQQVQVLHLFSGVRKTYDQPAPAVQKRMP